MDGNIFFFHHSTDALKYSHWAFPALKLWSSVHSKMVSCEILDLQERAHLNFHIMLYVQQVYIISND